MRIPKGGRRPPASASALGGLTADEERQDRGVGGGQVRAGKQRQDGATQRKSPEARRCESGRAEQGQIGAATTQRKRREEQQVDWSVVGGQRQQKSNRVEEVRGEA